MPVRLTPEPGAVIPTVRRTMEGWDADPDSPTVEYIEILAFLRSETLEAARKTGNRAIKENGRIREELNLRIYFDTLFSAQVKGWRLLDPDGDEIPFTPATLAALPWDVQGWLHEEILKCGGSIPTRDLAVRTESGQTLTYKSPDDRLGAGRTPAVSDPE
jgi:hypothetical protein